MNQSHNAAVNFSNRNASKVKNMCTEVSFKYIFCNFFAIAGSVFRKVIFLHSLISIWCLFFNQFSNEVFQIRSNFFLGEEGVEQSVMSRSMCVFSPQPTPTSRFILSYFGAVTSAVTVAVSSNLH